MFVIRMLCICFVLILYLYVYATCSPILEDNKESINQSMVVYATDRSKARAVLILCGFVVFTTGRFMFYSLALLFVLVFLHSF